MNAKLIQSGIQNDGGDGAFKYAENDSPDNGQRVLPKEEKKPAVEQKFRMSGTSTHYEEYRHPNMMTEKSFAVGRQTRTNTDIPDDQKGCFYYFRKFDDQILRPIFIYKYNQKKHMPEVDFQTLLKESENRGF